MSEKTLSKLYKPLAVLGIVTVLTNGYSVQAEQSNQSLYSYVMETYSKDYVDNTNAQDKLGELQEQYRIAEHSNLQAESFEILKEYSSTLEQELKIKIDEQINSLQYEQKEVSNSIEEGILNLTPMELSVLNRKYSKYQEDIDSVLSDKTSVSSLFSNPTYDKIDTEELELSIQEQENLISYDSSNNSTNLGLLSELKPPFEGTRRLTSHAGYRSDPFTGKTKFHDGTDYGVPVGTKLYSVFSGTVVSSGVNGGYGEAIKIDCGNGIILLYAHLSRRDVKVGDKITQNQMIGLSGNTGRSTGPHLHLSLFYKGEVLDIERLFQ